MCIIIYLVHMKNYGSHMTVVLLLLLAFFSGYASVLQMDLLEENSLQKYSFPRRITLISNSSDH